MSKIVEHLIYMAQFMPILIVGFLTTYGFTPLTKRLALHWNIVDQPNKRKIHREPIPLLGGVAIFVGLWVSLLLFRPPGHLMELGMVLASSTWLALVGYVDDRRGMNPLIKFSAQFIAGFMVMGVGIHVQLLNIIWLDGAITLIWIVGITNALNLMDNMDGLAAGITSIAAGAFFVLAATQQLFLVASLAAALCGASLGFLRYNFNPASTFMGDVGSLVIGFILAILGIKLDFPTQSIVVTWAIPILVLSIPIFDTTLVTFSRIWEGRSPFQGGKDHTSHRLVQLGLTHRQTVIFMYGSALLMGVMAFVISQASVSVATGLILLVGLCAIGAFIALEWSYRNFHE